MDQEKKDQEEQVEDTDTSSTNPSQDYTANQYATNPPPKKRLNRRFIYLLGALALLLILFGIFRVLGSNSKPTPTPTPTPSVEDFAPVEEATPEPTVEPTPTPSPTPKAANPVDSATGLDRSDLAVRVENGSGEVGVGKKMADFLKSLGYNIASTGNADNFDYTDVTIRVKSSQKKYLPLLNKDINSEYTVGGTSSDLSASSSADALVIVGK